MVAKNRKIKRKPNRLDYISTMLWVCIHETLCRYFIQFSSVLHQPISIGIKYLFVRLKKSPCISIWSFTTTLLHTVLCCLLTVTLKLRTKTTKYAYLLPLWIREKKKHAPFYVTVIDIRIISFYNPDKLKEQNFAFVYDMISFLILHVN